VEVDQRRQVVEARHQHGDRQRELLRHQLLAFGVDRDWLAASVPKKGAPTSKAVGRADVPRLLRPDLDLINKSVDGGKTFTQVDNVMATAGDHAGRVHRIAHG